MGARNVMIQYVGDILYLPKFERPVKRIIEQKYDISPFDRQEFSLVRTCKVEYPDDMRMCSECHYHIREHDLYCSHCGAKVVQGD